MWRILKYIFFLIVTIEVAKVSSQEHGFNNFLTMAMQDYPAWVVSSGLEPSPVIPYSISITGSSEHVSIVGDIRNQQIFNYPNIVVHEVGSDVLRSRFHISGSLRDFSVVGEYEVSGNVFTNIPVVGSGSMNMKVGITWFTISYTNFAVTADGFVDLSVATYEYLPHNEFGFYETITNFEGLSAGGFESNVVDFALSFYAPKDVKMRWFPVANHVHVYLEELFAKTPLSEIIGTTLRPPTTATTTTPTPEPTCPPCFTSPDLTCPPEPTCPPIWTEAPCEPCPTPVTPTTCPPSDSAVPRFSRTFYQTSLTTWPTQGFEIDMRIRATSPGGSPLFYELMTTFPFVGLTADQHIHFTMDISEGAYVGPNNVMVLEVLAEEVDDPTRFDTATVFIVFPRGSLADENEVEEEYNLFT